MTGFRTGLVGLALATGLAASAAAATTTPQVARDAAQRMQTAAGPDFKVEYSPLTGMATFMTARQRGIAVPGSTAPERAGAFLETYGAAFGISSTSGYAVSRVNPTDEVGMDHVRIQQMHGGVPVRAAELYVHLSGRRVVGVNGTTLPGLDTLNTEPKISPEAAVEAALAALASKKKLTDLEASAPRLEIFNRGLLEDKISASYLTWFVEARRLDVREFVWVDASSGAVLFWFSQLTDARNRQIHDVNSGSALPGPLVRSEGGPVTGLADADKAYDYSGDTYNYFFNNFGRDSYDGAGGVLRSTVRYCPGAPDPCPYPNAFWNGIQMVYGAGYSIADDVDAHELTHAVTERTAGLLYYMQSGALNESYSDVFGESVDLSNTGGTDTPGVRWQMGEDVPGLGAIRHMMNPGLFGDPAKVTGDANFKCDPYSDQGGVHSNSGVQNHAYALAVDGGSFNGKTVTPIGLAKAGRIWYRALSHYLLSGSDFLDNYRALNASCTDLVGTAGITAFDCGEVRDALEAVEMQLTLPCTPQQAARPEFCPAGLTLRTFFYESVENPSIALCPSATAPTTWCREGPTSLQGSNATSGLYSFWGDDGPAAGTIWLTLTLPGTLPSAARLQFNHQYGFEYDFVDDYDGGVLEYSINNGSTWADAAPLFNGGATYTGFISNCCNNPLANRQAFVENSWGYTTTQLSLSSLSGLPFQLRWTVGTDEAVGDFGWFVDDIRAYQCVFDTDLIFRDGFQWLP